MTRHSLPTAIHAILESLLGGSPENLGAVAFSARHFEVFSAFGLVDHSVAYGTGCFAEGVGKGFIFCCFWGVDCVGEPLYRLVSVLREEMNRKGDGGGSKWVAYVLAIPFSWAFGIRESTLVVGIIRSSWRIHAELS